METLKNQANSEIDPDWFAMEINLRQVHDILNADDIDSESERNFRDWHGGKFTDQRLFRPIGGWLMVARRNEEFTPQQRSAIDNASNALQDELDRVVAAWIDDQWNAVEQDCEECDAVVSYNLDVTPGSKVMIIHWENGSSTTHLSPAGALAAIKEAT